MEMRTKDMLYLFVFSESISVNFGPATPRASEEDGRRTRNRVCEVRYVHVAAPRASAQDVCMYVCVYVCVYVECINM